TLRISQQPSGSHDQRRPASSLAARTVGSGCTTEELTRPRRAVSVSRYSSVSGNIFRVSTKMIGTVGSAVATRCSSTALSVPNDDTTATRPSIPSAKISRSIVPTSTPSKRALSASASAWVKLGPVLMISTARLAILQFRMAQLPDRHGVVGRFLVDVRIAIERRQDVFEVQRHVRREAVEAAAAHEPDEIHQHVTGGLDLAPVAHLAKDAGAGEAAAVAELGKVDFHQAHAFEDRPEKAYVVTRLEPDRVGVRLVEERIEADRRLVRNWIVAKAQRVAHLRGSNGGCLGGGAIGPTSGRSRVREGRSWINHRSPP